MLERGVVVAVAPGVVDVRIEHPAECAECGACTQDASGQRVAQGVTDAIGARLGDVVEIETSAAVRRSAQVRVFVVPVLLLILGYLAGYLLGSVCGIAPDVMGAIAGLVASATAIYTLRSHGLSPNAEQRYPVRVHAIIAAAKCRADEHGA